MKSKIVLLIHKLIFYLKLENIIFLFSKLLSFPIWKLLPQNIMYNPNDKLKVKKNNIIFIINRSDFTQWQIYAEYPELHYQAFLKNNKIGNTIDVGANIGSFSLKVAKYLNEKNSEFKVYSFEPYNEIFEILKNNIDNNPSIKEFIVNERVALSDKINQKLNFQIIEKNLGANFLTKVSETESISDEKKIVLSDTLDNYCKSKNLNNITFIKIDVEGMELEVLDGGVEIINENKPALFIEVNETKYNEKNLSIRPYLHKFEKEKKWL